MDLVVVVAAAVARVKVENKNLVLRREEEWIMPPILDPSWNLMSLMKMD